MNNQEEKLSEVSTPIEDVEEIEAVEQKSDLELKDELTKLIGSKEVVLIVGAGSSKRLGYPDWSELILKIQNLSGEFNVPFKPDKKLRDYNPLEYVEKMKNHIFNQKDGEKKYYALFHRLFESKQYPPNGLDFHKTLVSLPFKTILTTNYDVVLEDALQAIGESSAHKESFIIHEKTAGQVQRFLTTINSKNIGVAHLHGKYNDAERIVLSSTDYEKAYGSPAIHETSKLNFIKNFCLWILSREINQVQQISEWTLHKKLLWTILATQRVVFVGFSMKDPYFTKMLETVSSDLWLWDRPIHFILTSISHNKTEALQAMRKAARFKDEYGIETLFYTDNDGKHQGLVDIIYEIAEELGVPVPSDTMHLDLPSETGDGLDKVKKMSELMVRKISNGN